MKQMRKKHSPAFKAKVALIERTDREIDNLVYDLYGLTEEERRIVEGEK